MPTVPEAGSRAEVLRRIRSAIGSVAPVETTLARASAAAEWASIPRSYVRTSIRQREDVLDLLEDRLRDYDAHVARADGAEVAEAIGSMLRSRGKRRMLTPEGFPHSLLPAGFEFVTDAGVPERALSSAEMDRLDGVLTECTVAIAQTGTLVLQGVPGQGRRAATLVPDYHLCVVRVDRVVETVSEAFDRLAYTASLPTTFVSGPSATADIEMTRIKGVHGPRFLDVLLLK